MTAPDDRLVAPTPDMVADAVYDGILECAKTLRSDCAEALEDALKVARSENPTARESRVLSSMVKNANIAATDAVPLCQDTGSVWVLLEVGEELCVPGNIFSKVDDAVARAYEDGRLRMSMVKDALFDRTNTQNNTPAFCEVKFTPGKGCTVHVLLKGGGSDNASRLIMLSPSAGRKGVIDEVIRCVKEKAANACPPLVIGVGVGATFDKVASLAKQALLRPLGSPAESAEAAQLEEDILSKVNETGIGPAALGGKATAYAVSVKTAPCHIAALPLAINMGCSAMRSCDIPLIDADGRAIERSDAGRQDERSPLADTTSENIVDATAATRIPALEITLPEEAHKLSGLEAGQEVLLSGFIYALRDAGHKRCMEMLEKDGQLPFGLSGQTIFYAGPSPASAGRPFGSIGPTTASRMDFAAPDMYRAGIAATIGKGKRSEEVRKACMETGGVYLAAVGGVAALLAERIESEEVIAWEDLGTEALRRIKVNQLPVYVEIDAQGNDLYRMIEE